MGRLQCYMLWNAPSPEGVSAAIGPHSALPADTARQHGMQRARPHLGLETEVNHAVGLVQHDVVALVEHCVALQGG